MSQTTMSTEQTAPTTSNTPTTSGPTTAATNSMVANTVSEIAVTTKRDESPSDLNHINTRENTDTTQETKKLTTLMQNLNKPSGSSGTASDQTNSNTAITSQPTVTTMKSVLAIDSTIQKTTVQYRQQSDYDRISMSPSTKLIGTGDVTVGEIAAAMSQPSSSLIHNPTTRADKNQASKELETYAVTTPYLSTINLVEAEPNISIFTRTTLATTTQTTGTTLLTHRTNQIGTTGYSTIRRNSRMKTDHVPTRQQMTTAIRSTIGLQTSIMTAYPTRSGPIIHKNGIDGTITDPVISGAPSISENQPLKDHMTNDSIQDKTLSRSKTPVERNGVDKTDYQMWLIISLAIISLLSSSLLIWILCCLRYGYFDWRVHPRRVSPSFSVA